MPLKTTPDEPPTMNMVPMIDILFNLIIFFMVGTQFAGVERDIGLQVPEVVDKTASTAAYQRTIVNVYGDGTIQLDGSPVTIEELQDQLARPESPRSRSSVLVRGDSASPFQRVAEVLNACKQAGVPELAISVRSMSEEKR